jgi:uncharacterized membrane protein YphA (DoxX/SURF4 family)
MILLSPIQGLGAFDVASLVDRMALGAFFTISGFHKLFNQSRRASLAATFKADNCYSPVMMWLIPMGELFGGLAVATGFLTPLACLGLIVICGGACLKDGLKRVRAWVPLDRADAMDDVLYLPETLYILMLVFLILIGPGAYSLDARIWPQILQNSLSLTS